MNTWYDLFDDWDLIESSFAMQYPSKDLYDDNMDYREFITLLNGLTEDTPLGKIISIRCESNEEIIKSFSESQKKIHDEWKKKQLELKYKGKNKEEVMADIKQMFKGMFA